MSLMTFNRLVPIPVSLVTGLAHTGLMKPERFFLFLKHNVRLTPFLLASLKLQLNPPCPYWSVCFCDTDPIFTVINLCQQQH